MLGNVSWGQFIGALIVLLVIYYLVIAGYLKKDVTAFLSKLQKKSDGTGTAKLTVEQLEEIVGDLRTNVFDAQGHSGSKEKIMELLKTRLSGYPGTKKKAYRYALGNAIIQQAAETCGVQIEEKELDVLWNKI